MIVVISKVDGSVQPTYNFTDYTTGTRHIGYLVDGFSVTITTEQVYDLSKITSAQLTGLLKNCLVKKDWIKFHKTLHTLVIGDKVKVFCVLTDKDREHTVTKIEPTHVTVDGYEGIFWREIKEILR
jgi:hypothetical protein